MYIINTIPHGKCFVWYLRTRCFCIRNLTRSLCSLVQFLIHQQLVRKYRTPALSMKYSLCHFWRGRGIGSNYENYWLDLIRRTIKSYRIVNQLFTVTGFEDNKLTTQPSSPYPAPPPGLSSNSPFPSCLKPLFQREAKCKATDTKLIFYCYANKTHLHKKGFALHFDEHFGNSEMPYSYSIANSNNRTW